MTQSTYDNQADRLLTHPQNADRPLPQLVGGQSVECMWMAGTVYALLQHQRLH